MEVRRIADQLQRAFEGPAWHGPSVLESLDGVTAKAAAAKPLVRTHSIWEITLHIAAWETVALRGLQGGSTNLTDEEDWPQVIDASEEAWKRALRSLQNGNAKLQQEILQFPDSKLDQIVDNEQRQTYYVLLHGVIQHDLYHAGQIAVLKKA